MLTKYHVVTFTPNYRFKLDQANHWGLRLGLGIGFSVSDIAWAKQITTASGGSQADKAGNKLEKIAGGANYALTLDGRAQTIIPPQIGTGCESARSFSDDNTLNLDLSNLKCNNGLNDAIASSQINSYHDVSQWLHGHGVKLADLLAAPVSHWSRLGDSNVRVLKIGNDGQRGGFLKMLLMI